MASGYGALCCLSGKKINNQDEKAGMPVAPRAEGKEPGQGASALSSALSAISPGPPASGQGAADDQGAF